MNDIIETLESIKDDVDTLPKKPIYDTIVEYNLISGKLEKLIEKLQKDNKS